MNSTPISDGPGGASRSQVVITLKKTPFFSSELSWKYNMLSVLVCASPLVMLLGMILSYLSYKAYPTSLFSAPEDEGIQGNGGVANYGGGSGQGGQAGNS